jgi:uncharacterized RDD family membrane protein YckC
MNCPSCKKETAPDSFFCRWCSAFIPAPEKGVKAGLFRRYFALSLDPFIALGLYFIGIALFGGAAGGAGAIAAALMLPLVYLIWWLSLFRKGQTPGKKLLSVQVVHHQTGAIPGFGKMFLREIIGKFVSGLFLGLGYFWAIFDKNNQAWHDKLAGTVVIKATGVKKAVSSEQQQRQQQIDSGSDITELPKESSAAEASTNMEEAEPSKWEGDERQEDVNQNEKTSQEARPTQRERGSLMTGKQQSEPEDQRELESSSGDEREEEWMGDEYWEREDERSK